MRRLRMKTDEKTLIYIAAGIAGIIAVYKISSGVSNSIESIGSGLGSGANNLLSGAGSGVASVGKGAEYLGQGAGAGIYEMGAGVGGGLFQVGSGIQAIGSGAGYALSGANIQDIIQTIIPYGKNSEASTYNSSIKLSQDQASSQGEISASTFTQSQASNDDPLLQQLYASSQASNPFQVSSSGGSSGGGSSKITGGVVSTNNTTAAAPIDRNKNGVVQSASNILTGLINQGGILDYRKPFQTFSNVKSIIGSAIGGIFRR
jgi:hypothetical protein